MATRRSSKTVRGAGATDPSSTRFERPVFRRLRVFPLDPESAARLEYATANQVVFLTPWEVDENNVDLLGPGPSGEYFVVVDEDQEGTRLHEPVDLNDPRLLATDGLSPCDSDPQFRQQMLYAVAMRTVETFESGLGRRVQWKQSTKKYQRQLRLYPHYLCDANAYYDESVGVCFGYFQADAGSPIRGTTIFSCLSQDVVAHQITHAILAGTHIGAPPDDGSDLLAFHEGFADIVALLQRFAIPEILRHQIAAARGNLRAPTALGTIAGQFAQGLGLHGGLRNPLGSFDSDGSWKPVKADPNAYAESTEPHDRGAVLVRAVFDAMDQIYRARVADLFRIASEGTGVLEAGELHPDLVNRLAREAALAARHVLTMCIRALDYCPVADFRFGDFLRALVTADSDVEPLDPRNYRIAFVDAFRRHGLLPQGIGTLSVQSMCWPAPAVGDAAHTVVRDSILAFSRRYSAWTLPRDREQLYRWTAERVLELQAFLFAHRRRLRGALGEIDTMKPFSVRSLFPSERVGCAGNSVSRWIIQLEQRGSGNALVASCGLLVDTDTGLVQTVVSRRVAAARKRAQKIPPPLLPVPPTNGARRVPYRRLRAFAFDPSLDMRLDTVAINQITLKIPWRDELDAGPIDEYLEVVDFDPASGCFYAPINLNDRHVLATDGLAPSQSNPQFHQQMVYAVASRTIRNFEKALGRLALWAPQRASADQVDSPRDQFVRRLRLYPHALREANAYYSPKKVAVLFGYFQPEDAKGTAGRTVFTCLSHDIIAHEVTHALLDGMHRRFREPSNPDVLAFHEAFADIVALFQHFSIPEVLAHQIAATRGDLASQNRLGELAQEFGSAIGRHGALRNALGEVDPATGEWRPRKPDPEAYAREFEPHARGALLVAAIFDAFLTIYRTRVADLFRIATRGSGVLPAGSLHPDLVGRLAGEASAVAQQVLDMCIRALDYCPPVDLTFGDYLRALVTADTDRDPVDAEHRRVAVIEAFQRHGILPDDVRTMSSEGLLWKETTAIPDEDASVVAEFLRDCNRKIQRWNLTRDRESLFDMMARQRAELHQFIVGHKSHPKFRDIINRDHKFEVHSLRPSKRFDWQGRPHYQWIIEITQRQAQYFDETRTPAADAEPDFWFRGGTTLIVDAETGFVRYTIRKRLDSVGRKQRQREFMSDISNRSLHAVYAGRAAIDEPFAILHRH